MYISLLSVSRGRIFIQCSYKYSKEYMEDKSQMTPRQPQEYLEIGTVLHSVFERIYREYGTRVHEEIALAIYDEEFRANQDLNSSEHYKHGVEIIRTFINNDDNFAFEVMATKDGTPALELEFYIDLEEKGKTYPNYEEAYAAAKEGKRILRGFIDKVLKIDDTTAMVVDYKTGWVVKSRTEVEQDEQLHAYNLAVRTLFPEIENVIVALNFVRFDKPVMSMYSADDAEIYRRWFLNLFHTIQNAEEPKPRKNEYCPSCQFRQECPLYQEAIGTPYEIPDFDKSDEPARLWALREELRAQEKIVGEAKKEIDIIFKAVMSKHNLQSVDAGEVEVYLSPNPRQFYPLSVVAKEVPIEELVKEATISNSKAEALVKKYSGPEGVDRLNDNNVRYYNAPTLRQKKKS